MKYDLIICTTAVTRPELHSDIFPDYVKFLADLKCLWLINIDCILDKKIDETISNLNTLIGSSSNLTVEYNVTGTGGERESFYTASKFLIEKSLELKNQSKYGVFWLEDDWRYIGIKNLKSLLEHEPFSAGDFMMLSKRNDKTILSFNPGVWGWELFEEICYKGIQKPFTEKNNNPERACVYPIEEMNKKVSKSFKYASFEDAGRKWQKRNNINRTFKLHFKPAP